MKNGVYQKFDLNIQDKVKVLCIMADKKLPPTRNYFMEITFWDDTDYSITLKSCWGDYKDVFTYRKSTDNFIYSQQS